MRNDIVVALLAALIMLALTACSTAPSGNLLAAEKEPYRFAAILPMTGANSYNGAMALAGIELAVEDINAAGGINGRRVVLIIEDSASDPGQASLAAKKLTELDRVDALFSTTTYTAGVVAPIAEESKTPYLYYAGTVSFAQNKKYVFKEYPDARDICEQLLNQSIKDGHERIAVLGRNIEFTHLCRERIEQLAPERLVAVEMYGAEEKDYRTQIMKVQASGATGIVISGYENECPLIYRQLAESGYRPQLYVSYYGVTCGTKANSALGRELLEGAYGSDMAVDESSTDAAFVRFRKRLEERNATTNIAASALYYDMTQEMATAYTGCQTRECAVQNLRALDFTGLAGKASYDGGQVVRRDVMLANYKNGSWNRVHK